MAIPDYQALMLPLLEAISDGAEHQMGELTRGLASVIGLTPQEQEQLLPSGQQTVIANRIGWTKTYLKKAGLVHNTVRGRVQITEEGRKLLAENPAAIDRRFLEKRFPAFKVFINQVGPNNNHTGQIAPITTDAIDKKTPEEAIEESYLDLRYALADELIDRVKACSPKFFEHLVIRLLVAMGYGGTLADAGQAVGRTGDGGIDGIIKEDKLGLDVVCVQAKRWEGSVGRPVVQAFAGSMEGVRARKGVLITTSSFSGEAKDFVSRLERRIVLIDGKQLAQYMIDYDIGVMTERTFTLKRPDADFFEEV